MHIGIAADHGGLELKAQLTAAQKAVGYEVTDFGAHELVTGDERFRCRLAKVTALERERTIL